MPNYEIISERPTANRPPKEVLRYGITEAALNSETALFDVLPGVGKSRTIPKLATLDIPLSVFTNLEDNYAQFERWGHKDGVRVERFPVATNDCPTLAGDYPDSVRANAGRDAYFDKSWPASVVHREFDLPCQQGDSCPYEEKKNSLDMDNPGMLVGYYSQAYNPHYLDDRGVVIDENCFDEFVREVRKPRQKAQEFIDTLDNFPFEQARRPDPGEEDKRDRALARLEDLGLDPYNHRDSVGEFHAMGPLLAYTIYGAERMENGIYHAELPGERTATFTASVGDSTVRLFDPPDFSKAEFVIALDATPCVSQWKRLLGDDLNHYRLYEDEQRNQYLRDEGFKFIQLNSYAWPANGGNLSLNKCEAYLREVKREHGQCPDLVSSLSIIDGLKERGLEHLWREDLHYGDLRGKNDLKDSELLVVLGSPSRGDDYYKHLAALHGECAQREEGTEGAGLSYGSKAADDLLKSTRRGGVFQAAMRAGRSSNAEATVYIATAMVPKWLETEKVGRRRPDGSFDACIRMRNENEGKVIGVLQQEDGISGREVARQTGLPKSTVLDALNRLRDDGLVEKAGRGRGVKWRFQGNESTNIAGYVRLDRMAEIPLDDSIRASRPFSGSREPADPHGLGTPLESYPRWMLDVQRRARWRWESEQLSQITGGSP